MFNAGMSPYTSSYNPYGQASYGWAQGASVYAPFRMNVQMPQQARGYYQPPPPPQPSLDWSSLISMLMSMLQQRPAAPQAPIYQVAQAPVLPKPVTKPIAIAAPPVPLPPPIPVAQPLPQPTYSLPITLVNAKRVAKQADTNDDNLLTTTELNAYKTQSSGQDRFISETLSNNFGRIASKQRFLVGGFTYDLPGTSHMGLQLQNQQAQSAIVIDTYKPAGGVFVNDTPEVAAGITLNPEDQITDPQTVLANGGIINGYSIWGYQRSDLERLAKYDGADTSISQTDLDQAPTNYINNVFASRIMV